MGKLSLSEAEKALRYVDWSDLLTAEDDEIFPVLVNGEAVTATKVFSEDKEDNDYDRQLQVVVKIGDQYFRREGWANVGSHCYGEYEPSWGSLKEVNATPKYVTVYEEV